MKRREFLQFMGVSAATTAASTALAKIPEAQSQIILLDKPKDIILAKELPDVDFVVENLVGIEYKNIVNDAYFPNVARPFKQYDLYSKGISIEIKIEVLFNNYNLYEKSRRGAIFTFDLDIKDNDQNYHLNVLNGRRFLMLNYDVTSNAGSFTTANINGIEIDY